ncbi:OmpP1/FadL family transporter [Zhongshania guokunii]|uniref:OmpP1/FadL family transporter n=1 Tax=Zhongshania guokunii TaxID=641783 RepID=A0ABV3UC37_9GAMM
MRAPLKSHITHNIRCRVMVLLAATLPIQSWAGIGILPLSFGYDSISMASTDMGFSSDPLSINNNTAGIAKSKKSELTFILEPLAMPLVRHADSLGNDQRTNNDRPLLISGAWISPIKSHPDITAGLGVFAQGGVGFGYQDLNTVFGNKDDISATFGVFRIAPAIAWKLTERLRIGLSASINYSKAEQELFPNTSDASSGFAGLDISDLSGVSYAWRAGVQYDLSNTVTIGLAYGSATELVLDDGNAMVNFEAMGLGRVKYNFAQIDGLSLPSELGIGFAWHITPQLSIGSDLNWYRWSQALGEVTTQLSNPQTNGAPSNITIKGDFGGHDQFSTSVGAQYQINDRTQISGGINHVGNLVKHGYESPLNNLITDWNITAGIKHKYSPHWTSSLAYTYIPTVETEYTNTQLPLGSDAKETFGGYSVAFGLSYQW